MSIVEGFISVVRKPPFYLVFCTVIVILYAQGVHTIEVDNVVAVWYLEKGCQSLLVPQSVTGW